MQVKTDAARVSELLIFTTHSTILQLFRHGVWMPHGHTTHTHIRRDTPLCQIILTPGRPVQALLLLPDA